MPAVFFGHGNPLNALADNDWTRAWARLGQALPRPRAILMMSAHWYLPALSVTAMETPRTLHTFRGFPQALFDVQYPAPGAPWLAARVAELLQPDDVDLDRSWGLDHGTWSVLRHSHPQADVPVVQLSLDSRLPPQRHHELALRLAPLRDEGVLVAGSGNIVHNLQAYAWKEAGPVAPQPWAERFEDLARGMIAGGDLDTLVDYPALGPDAALSIPTLDHYLPLLYVLALHDGTEPIRVVAEGFDGGTVSMLSLRLG